MEAPTLLRRKGLMCPREATTLFVCPREATTLFASMENAVEHAQLPAMLYIAIGAINPSGSDMLAAQLILKTS